MFKDYNKYLSTSFKVYLFVLAFLFILKLVGLDYFGLDNDNKIMVSLEIILSKKWYLRDLLLFIPLWIHQFVVLSISSNDNSKKMIKLNLILIPLYYLFEIYKLKLYGNMSFIAEILYFFIILILYNKKITKDMIKRYVNIVIFVIIVQMLSMFVRFNVSAYVTETIPNILLNLDYTIIMLIAYKVHFMKGVDDKCYQVAQYSSLLQKMNLRNLPKRLLTNLHKFYKQNKVTKLTIVFYSILSFIWNVFTLIIILLIAKINGTIIECLFIATTFWITKTTFGKAFHLPNMFQCFIVSNLTYYVLNRITTPLGISILVPIMLGVGLSYVTSKLVKKIYKPLYRGMPKELFEEIILKVEDKDSVKYNICYEYYIEKKIAINLSMKYHYSEAGIRKILKIVNKKIKELNK